MAINFNTWVGRFKRFDPASKTELELSLEIADESSFIQQSQGTQLVRDDGVMFEKTAKGAWKKVDLSTRYVTESTDLNSKVDFSGYAPLTGATFTGDIQVNRINTDNASYRLDPKNTTNLNILSVVNKITAPRVESGSYYLVPAGISRLNALNINGSDVITTSTIGNYMPNVSSADMTFAQNGQSIWANNELWLYNYVGYNAINVEAVSSMLTIYTGAPWEWANFNEAKVVYLFVRNATPGSLTINWSPDNGGSLSFDGGQPPVAPDAGKYSVYALVAVNHNESGSSFSYKSWLVKPIMENIAFEGQGDV